MGSVFTEITCSGEVITLRPFNTDDQRTEQSGGKQDQLVIGLLLVQKKSISAIKSQPMLHKMCFSVMQYTRKWWAVMEIYL